jgi:hypothetical protein
MYTRCVRVCVCVRVWESAYLCVCVCARSECTDMYVYMFSRDLSLFLCASERDGHLPAVCVYLDTYAYTCESVNRLRHTDGQTDGQTDRKTDRLLLSLLLLLLLLLLLFITSLSLPALGSAGAGGGGESLSLCTAGRARPGTTRRRSVLGFVRCDRKFPKKNLKSQYPRTITVQDHY